MLPCSGQAPPLRRRRPRTSAPPAGGLAARPDLQDGGGAAAAEPARIAVAIGIASAWAGSGAVTALPAEWSAQVLRLALPLFEHRAGDRLASVDDDRSGLAGRLGAEPEGRRLGL